MNFQSIVRCKRAKNVQSYWIPGPEIFDIYFELKEKPQTIEKC